MHRYELGKRRATLRFCPTYDYFCRGVPVRKGQLEAVMVCRLKSDLSEVVGGISSRTVRNGS